MLCMDNIWAIYGQYMGIVHWTMYAAIYGNRMGNKWKINGHCVDNVWAIYVQLWQ